MIGRLGLRQRGSVPPVLAASASAWSAVSGEATASAGCESPLDAAAVDTAGTAISPAMALADADVSGVVASANPVAVSATLSVDAASWAVEATTVIASAAAGAVTPLAAGVSPCAVAVDAVAAEWPAVPGAAIVAAKAATLVVETKAAVVSAAPAVDAPSWAAGAVLATVAAEAVRVEGSISWKENERSLWLKPVFCT